MHHGPPVYQGEGHLVSKFTIFPIMANNQNVQKWNLISATLSPSAFEVLGD
jgi:hypothetical protein